MAHHGWVALATVEDARSGLVSPFGRLFASESHTLNSHAISLLAGALGPLHDAGATPSGKPSLPAGFTPLGQFVDHDLTEFRVVGPDLALIERNPTFEQRQRVLQDGDPTTTNGRTGLLDLDSVYGLLELGAVAGLIVAETILGSLAAAAEFDLVQEIVALDLDSPAPYAPKDTPDAVIGSARDIVSMVDLLRFLGEI